LNVELISTQMSGKDSDPDISVPKQAKAHLRQADDSGVGAVHFEIVRYRILFACGMVPPGCHPNASHSENVNMKSARLVASVRSLEFRAGSRRSCSAGRRSQLIQLPQQLTILAAKETL
jgi:hypothetical protein